MGYSFDKWYYLDPDNNRKPPIVGLYCSCCNRKLKETMAFEKFHSIELHPDVDTPWFKIAAPGRGNHLIGDHCFKRVLKEFGEMGDAS